VVKKDFMNQVPKQYPGWLDGGTMMIASLTDLPSQPVNMNPANAFLGVQIQNLKVNAEPPVVDSAAPVTVTRRSLGGGQFQYRVQFIAPTRAQDPHYQTTSILLASAGGTVRLAASAGVGPIVFNSSQTTAPGSLVVQQNNSNATSNTGLGTGNSRTLVQI
jgi:hypothetical protein